MAKIFTLVGFWVVSSIITRLLAALGLGFFTYKAVYKAVDGFISYLQPIMNGLPADSLNLLAIMGVPEAMSIILSAYATAASLKAASIFVGVRT